MLYVDQQHHPMETLHAIRLLGFLCDVFRAFALAHFSNCCIRSTTERPQMLKLFCYVVFYQEQQYVVVCYWKKFDRNASELAGMCIKYFFYNYQNRHIMYKACATVAALEIAPGCFDIRIHAWPLHFLYIYIEKQPRQLPKQSCRSCKQSCFNCLKVVFCYTSLEYFA